eukprot:12237720-Ditylum_brightwellii.AAC.1
MVDDTGERVQVNAFSLEHEIQEQEHKVEDCPKQFDRGSSHNIKTKDGVKISLSMKGLISYIPMKKPTESELESYKINRIEITSDSPWSPHGLDYESKEKNLTDGEKTAIHYTQNRLTSEVNIADDNNLYNRLMVNSAKELLPDTNINSGLMYRRDMSSMISCCERGAGGMIGMCCDN